MMNITIMASGVKSYVEFPDKDNSDITYGLETGAEKMADNQVALSAMAAYPNKCRIGYYIQNIWELPHLSITHAADGSYATVIPTGEKYTVCNGTWYPIIPYITGDDVIFDKTLSTTDWQSLNFVGANDYTHWINYRYHTHTELLDNGCSITVSLGSDTHSLTVNKGIDGIVRASDATVAICVFSNELQIFVKFTGTPPSPQSMQIQIKKVVVSGND